MSDDDSLRLPDDQINAIRDALFGGNKILAIKLYRQATGLGLAESKAFIDALELRLRQQEPQGFTAAAEGKTGCFGVITLIGATSVLVRWFQ